MLLVLGRTWVVGSTFLFRGFGLAVNPCGGLCPFRAPVLFKKRC